MFQLAETVDGPFFSCSSFNWSILMLLLFFSFLNCSFNIYCCEWCSHFNSKVYRDSFIVFFVCLRRNQLSNLAFTTTIIEDTHLTLAVILFKVEANNSLIFLLLQTYEKEFAEFPFLFSLYFLALFKELKIYKNGNFCKET